MYDIFETRKINYNLRSQINFASICVNTKKFSVNSLRYFAFKVWSMVPLEIKNSRSVKTFKAEIRNWEPKDCYYYYYYKEIIITIIIITIISQAITAESLPLHTVSSWNGTGNLWFPSASR